MDEKPNEHSNKYTSMTIGNVLCGEIALSTTCDQGQKYTFN